MSANCSEENTSRQGETTPLECAVDFESFVQKLLIDPKDAAIIEKAEAALLEYCRNGDKNRVEILLKQGVRVECGGDIEKTALMHACDGGHGSIAALLVEHGADVNSKDNNGKTPLMIASEKGHGEIVELMLNYPTDVNATDSNGFTALMLSCQGGHESVVDLLAKCKADTNATQDEWKRTALCFGVAANNINIVKTLLNHGARVNDTFLGSRTALMLAINKERFDIVVILLEHGADVHITDVLDGNAIVQSCVVGNVEIMELLVKHGADVNYGGEDIFSPLMAACRSIQENAVECLLKHGADVNASFDDQDNVLWYICNYEGGNENIINMIIEHGLDIHHKLERGETVLMGACKARDEIMVGCLIKHGAKTDDKCDRGMTPAMHAADYGGHSCLELLIDAGANLDCTDANGCTVLSWVLQNDYDPEPSLKLLMKEGVLLKDGKLKPCHKRADFTYSYSDAVLTTMELGWFEWEFCPSRLFKKVCFAALKYGFCPGRITHEGTTRSPLVLAFLENDTEAIEMFLQYIYYFPEDFKTLTRDKQILSKIRDSNLLNNLTHQTLSLFTWSFLTVSNAISKAGPFRDRCERINKLAIPNVIKKRLKYQMD